ISLELVPFLLAQAAGGPPPAAALPPALGAAVPPLESHAASASTLTAASAPTLDSFMQYLLQITGRIRLPRSGSRSLAVPRPTSRPPSHALPGGDDRARRAVRVTTIGTRLRAARRWPPKRCRILPIGDLNAIP